MKYYRIRDWGKHFENNRTRDLKRMEWLPVPNRHDGDGFTELLTHANGMAHYGAWHLILQVASKCDPRGTLLREGAGGVKTPHTPESLARMTRGSVDAFREVLPRLVSIGWVEFCDDPALPCAEAAPSCAQVPMERNGMERNGIFAERASEQEVLAYASRIGLSEWKARDWFQEMEGCGWLDHNQRPIAKWQAVLLRVKTKWEADGRPSSPPAAKGQKPAKPESRETKEIIHAKEMVL